MTTIRIVHPPPRPQTDPIRTPTAMADARQRFSELLRQRRDSPPLPLLCDELPATEALAAVDAQPARAGDDEEPPPAPPEASPAQVAASPAPEQPVLPQTFPAAPEPPAAAPDTDALEPLDPQGQRLVAQVADTIAGFCNERAISDSEGWQVRMALRPEVLPSTTLSLAISPHWLQLRFDIGDPNARRLVSLHQIELARMLNETLKRRREIDIRFD